MKRTIVIGDLHGTYDEAKDLLNKCQVTSEDRVILCGDLVDRGPKRRECVELAMKHESILGNHEEKHLFYCDKPQVEVKEDHAETRRVLQQKHYDYFRTLPLIIRLPEYNAAVIHAGVLPGIPLEKQDPSKLLHCLNIKPPGIKSFWPSKAPPDFKHWVHYWQGPERLIFGHTVLSKPLVTEWAVGIDTGCVFGHTLTAVILPDWEIVSVPARKEHFYSRHRSIAKYPVIDDVFCYS